MSKPADPHVHKIVNEKDKAEKDGPVIPYWLTILILLLVTFVALMLLKPWADDDEMSMAKSVADSTQVDSTPKAPAIVLQPARKDCDVTDSTQTFCSSDLSVMSISDKGELDPQGPGTVRICARKPITSITYTVVQNNKLDFTSSLDIMEPRCDIFYVVPKQHD